MPKGRRHTRVGRLLARLGERHYEEVIEQERKSLELAPESKVPLQWLGQIHTAQHQYAEAAAELEENIKWLAGAGRASTNTARLALAYGPMGQHSRAESLKAEVEKRYKPNPTAKAILCLAVNDKDCAMKRVLQLPRGQGLMNLRSEPTWDPLRGDPRFVELVRTKAFGVQGPRDP